MARPKASVPPATFLRGRTDAEEGFRLAYIEGAMTFHALLKRFRLSGTRAARIIRECPECRNAKAARHLQQKRERLKKARFAKYRTAMQHFAEVHADMLDRINHLTERVKHLETLLNVQANLNDDGPEPE